ncbi:MAG TPA: ATP-dependent Clp protease adapter ClpS [Candidatus Rifleibacterium sp.]|nr:ATP-dependent Clp protease adapter ClpS [Candidatus Rifleibacterium sp.]HPT44859.1 ATP-dependent Clp protease adapter ClpS [Candidatus Rifleibacterium sp.]
MGQNEDSPQRGVIEKSRAKTTRPSMYKVFLLNDDYTTMDFVVEILETVFGRSKVDATSIMLHVHRNGKGLAGVFTREIAETKIAQVHALARENGFPLKCDMEKE